MIGFLVAGLIIGALARLIKPGKQNLGILATLGLGLVGSLIGGVIAQFFGTGSIWELNVLGFVLAQHAPSDVRLEAVTADLTAIDGVADVHDLHVWTLTSGMHVATAHLVAAPRAAPGVLAEAQRVLRQGHRVAHATLQVEEAKTRECHELDW